MSSDQANIVHTTKNLLNWIYWINQRSTQNSGKNDQNGAN